MKLQKQILMAMARGYCSEKNKHKILDSDLIESMCDEVLSILKEEWIDASELLPSIEQCKFSNYGKRIGCEYGPARYASQVYGTKAEKRNEAYMMVCQSVQEWLDFFTDIQKKKVNYEK